MQHDLRVTSIKSNLRSAVKSQTSLRQAMTKGYIDNLNNSFFRYRQRLIKKNVPIYHPDN